MNTKNNEKRRAARMLRGEPDGTARPSLQPGGKTPGPGVRNVNNQLRALPGACVRSPAADPGLESGVDGPPAGIPLVDLLGLLAGDPGQVPHGPAYVDQVLLPAPFDQGVQLAAPGGVLVDQGHPLARQLLGPGLVLRRHILACHGPYRKDAWGRTPTGKGRACARTGCRSSGRAYQGFQSKDPKPERIIEGDALHSRAAAGKSKEHPEGKSAAFVCRSSVWCHMDGRQEERSSKRSRWPEAPAGMVQRLPGNRLCRSASCRQRADSGSEWAGCCGVRRVQASWGARRGLHQGHNEVIVKEAEPGDFVAFHIMTVTDVWRYLIGQHRHDR